MSKHENQDFTLLDENATVTLTGRTTATGIIDIPISI
jgi:alcohol dehydrogenase YqhD (iron-dependent ADH family)